MGWGDSGRKKTISADAGVNHFTAENAEVAGKWKIKIPL